MNCRGIQIYALEHLYELAKNRQSVLVSENSGNWHHRQPAAWVINRPGYIILRMFKAGMFLYIPKKPQDPNKPPRGGRKPKTLKPAPILNLPYYPNLQSSH